MKMDKGLRRKVLWKLRLELFCYIIIDIFLIAGMLVYWALEIPYLLIFNKKQYKRVKKFGRFL